MKFLRLKAGVILLFICNILIVKDGFRLSDDLFVGDKIFTRRRNDIDSGIFDTYFDISVITAEFAVKRPRRVSAALDFKA